MHVFVCASVFKFQERNSFKGGKNVKLGKIRNFLKNGKMVIIIHCHNGLGKPRKFARS